MAKPLWWHRNYPMMTKAKLNEILTMANILNDISYFNIDESYNNPFIEDDYRTVLKNFIDSSKQILVLKISAVRYPANLKYYNYFKSYVGMKAPIINELRVSEVKRMLDTDFQCVESWEANHETWEIFYLLYVVKGKILYE